MIAAKVAQRARARLAARAPRGDRRGRRRRPGRARTRTAERARAAGADQVLELPRGGKVRAQDAAVRAASGELLAFSDANATWEPDALAPLAAAFADPAVGYACGQVRFVSDAGTNQEGVYWRYELWLRAQESALASVTAGNGAIYAVRREAYVEVDPVMGHDLSFPYLMVKRGWRAVYVPAARATEKMVPSIEGEWRRKRRMMSHAWPIVLRGGLLSPRGYGPLYGLMIVSHRVLRYASPALHVLAVACRAAARAPAGLPRRRSPPTRRCWRPRWRAGRCGRGRCCSRATTCSPPPRSPPGSTTTCATARRRAGTRRRARGELSRQARARPRAGRDGAALERAAARRRGGADPARVPRPPDLPPAPRRARRAAVRALQAAHDGHRCRASWARG